jgi:hypothetical protein
MNHGVGLRCEEHPANPFNAMRFDEGMALGKEAFRASYLPYPDKTSGFRCRQESREKAFQDALRTGG